MINTILAIDEQDESLGKFFSECLQDLESYENDTFSFRIIRSAALNDLAISLHVPNDAKFIFLAYSHGSDNELLASGIIPYISESLNISIFKDSLFYTCSCSTRKRLGQLLIDNHCKSYIGYKDKFEIWDFNRKPFVECANYGFKLLATGINIGRIIISMKNKYDEHIDNYNNDFFGAAHLLANKNALIALGEMELSISDLI